MSKRTILWLIPTVALLAAAAVPSAFAEETAGRLPAAAVEQAPSPGATGCGEALDLAPDGAAGAPAVTPAALEPVFLAPPFFRRTCRCSCGFPCKTDADCGPGGICSAGITCC